MLKNDSTSLYKYSFGETDNMKIGIITFHSKVNYGAIFQTYALQTVLTRMGHDVEIIDYWPQYRLNASGLFRKPAIKTEITRKYIALRIYTLFKDILNLNMGIKRKKYFEEYFSKYLHISKNTFSTYDDLVECKNTYDFFLAGSDQIWNPKLTGGKPDPAYFLAFVGDPKCCAAYAVSMGKDRIDASHVEEFRELVQNIGTISVRESSAIPFVQQESGKNVVAVLDPTLLLKREEWTMTAQSPKRVPNKYLLVFTVGANTSIFDFVQKTSHTLDLPIIYVGGGMRNIPHASYVHPCELQWYFAHAAFVVTDSFHGTAFSIINKKPFYTITPFPRNERITDLLKQLDLLDRTFESGKDVKDINRDIDYDAVYKKLNLLRDKSLDYLREITKEKIS